MERIIYSNYNLSDMFEDVKQLLIDEYPEKCDEVLGKDNAVTYEPSDETVWNEIYFQNELDWEEVFYSLKNLFAHKQVIFFGSLGLWNGNFDGGKIGDFEDLFYNAIKDCNYIELTDINGHLFLHCSHHDGTNYFEIRELTNKGYNFYDTWNYSNAEQYDFTEKELHRRITNCSFLSRLPHYCKKIWGSKN